MLDAVEIETGRDPGGTVIWLHGLGADGNDFVPMVPELRSRSEPALRFLFPHAPVRPVTLNGGYRMRAWYDIVAIDRRARQDEEGLRVSGAAIGELIAREGERGVPPSRIVLGGFSQGGAQALYTGLRHAERLAGIAGLSCYLPAAPRLEAERTAVNHSTPIFLAHGAWDDVVHPDLGEDTRAFLESARHPVEWRSYPMGHSVAPDEIADLAAWIRRVLGEVPMQER